MRLVIPLWRDGVSPVFDAAAKLLVIDIEDTREVARRVIPLGTADGPERADRLAAMGPRHDNSGLSLDGAVCDTVLAALIHEGFLRRKRDSSFVRTDRA